MKQFTYTIQDSMGIHARPAGLLVKAAAAFKDTTIEISSNGKKADVKRIMAIMSMGVKQGAEVTVTCEGADEDAAMKKLISRLLRNSSKKICKIYCRQGD